ncbi:MAG: hypothetical protein ACK53R_07410 [Bacteroidota bacterium]
MKSNNLFIIALLGSLILFSRCSTDFELTSDWKDITIVYGILSYTDTAIYVKVNKAYLDKKTNALVQAQIPDSTYYNNISVSLTETNNVGTVTNNFTLEKVDGNDEGFTKEEGIFPQTPNYLYKVKYSPKPDRFYSVSVNKGDENVSTATTNIVNEIVVIKPTIAAPISLLPGDNSFTTVSWKNPKNGKFYGLTIRINYVEYPNASPQDSIRKSIEWKIFDEFLPDIPDAGTTVEFKLFTQGMYTTMAQLIPVNTSVTRVLRQPEFIFGSGAEDLYTYIQVVKSKEGITQGQIQPDFTNVTNGLGLFTSRSFKTSPISLKPSTLDSVACRSFTKSLRFLNSSGQLCPE